MIEPKYKDIVNQIYEELSSLDVTNKNLNSHLEKIIGGKFSQLIEEKWKRREVFALLQDLISRNLESKVETYLWDVETAITGNCDTQSIIKFDDDPIDVSEEEFRDYVLSEKWK